MNYAFSPLAPAVAAWLDKIAAAARFKQTRFGAEAAEGMRFFSGPYDFWFENLRTDKYFRVTNERMADDTIVVTVNKVAEMVQIFGPYLYNKNPNRRVSQEVTPALDPAALGFDQNTIAIFQQAMMAQESARLQDRARAGLFETLLNYTPAATDLKTSFRRGVDEAIIKGASCLWTEVCRKPGEDFKMVGSFYDSVDRLFIDPDAKTIQDAKWIARGCVGHAWDVERHYNLPPGYLKPSMESASQWAAVNATGLGPLLRSGDRSSDLVVYYKVWSKMGVGGRLNQVADGNLRAVLDLFGDNCHVAVMHGLRHPLNVPPWMYDGTNGFDAARAAVQWETPFWKLGQWPVTLLSFHEIPNDPWPMSHLSPGMGELKFLNWAFSKMVNKIKVTSRDIIVTDEKIGEELDNAIKSGVDLEVVKASNLGQTDIRSLVTFLQHPTWNSDWWRVMQEVSQAFDKRVGLTDLIYGVTATQIRSSAEAQIRNDNISIRPDDMAARVEDAASACAAKEMFASHWHLTPADVTPILGPLGGYAWQQIVYVTDPRAILYNLRAHVEQGTARKPNKQELVDSMQQAMNTLFPHLMQYAMQTGQVAQLNALITDWARANNIQDVERYLLQPIPPPAGPAR